MKSEPDKSAKDFKNSFLKNKDGFFEVPYQADSPGAMVKSFDAMPFSLHDKQSKVFVPDNPFFKGHLYYRELEPGFWIFLSDLKYKQNVSYKSMYNSQMKYDHFMLYFHFSPIESSNKHQLINGLSLSNCSWSLCKPGTSLAAFHFKESHSMNITIHFREDWLKKRILKEKKFRGSKFMNFLRSETKHIIWSDVREGKILIFHLLSSLLRDKKTDLNNPEISRVTEELFFSFVQKYNAEMVDADYFKLSSENRQKIQNAEKKIVNGLFGKFPGIEKLAKEVGLSVTKLKTDFKIVYGKSIFQYYRDKQLLFAREMLQKKDRQVKDIAAIFGYDNPGKFSSAFKNRFGILPSQVT